MIYIVLPAYNEGETIGPLCESLIKYFNKNKNPYRVLIVNDGSTDTTREVAQSYIKKMPLRIIDHGKNKGLGRAFRTGLKEAVRLAKKDDIIITMDADNSHRPESIVKMIDKINKGNDVVTASKFEKGTKIIGVPKNRQLISYVGSFIFRIILPIKGIKEYTCAYRAYKPEILKKAFRYYGDKFIDQKGFASTSDILLKLRRFDIQGAEIPLILRYDLKLSSSKMNTKKHIVDTLKLITKRKLEDWGISF